MKNDLRATLPLGMIRGHGEGLTMIARANPESPALRCDSLWPQLLKDRVADMGCLPDTAKICLCLSHNAHRMGQPFATLGELREWTKASEKN